MCITISAVVLINTILTIHPSTILTPYRTWSGLDDDVDDVDDDDVDDAVDNDEADEADDDHADVDDVDDFDDADDVVDVQTESYLVPCWFHFGLFVF
jgi:hypothetical protein